MGNDRNFYYDFQLELSIDNWVVKNHDKELFTLEGSVEISKSGRYILLFNSVHEKCDFELIRFNVQNEIFKFNWKESEITYIAESNVAGLRYAYKIYLEIGVHKIELHVRTKFDAPEKEFQVNIISEQIEASIPEKVSKILYGRNSSLGGEPNTDENINPVSMDGFRPGIGVDPSAGRFGFTKGDGLLDCAMPILGVIDKMYLCGHPRYLKPFKWTFSVLPFGIDPEKQYHGSFPPAQVGIENDEIVVNHLSVSWKTSYDTVDDFYERKAGEKVEFACTYSLGSAGIMIESSDPGICLSMLEYAGNYQYLLVPGSNGVRGVSLHKDFRFDGDMNENWLLLFGATEFPDLPILLVFEKPPAEIKVCRDDSGRLASLDFHIPPKNAKMIAATPFGIESLDANMLDDEPFLVDAIGRCRFWSRALLAYPVKCEEFYKCDDENEIVEIVQKFHYRMVKDQWNTIPLKVAPLPPVLSMLDGTGIVEFEKNVKGLNFPTKYGFLKGACGKDTVSYKVPYLPRERKFPLRDSRNDKISDLLAEDLKEYFAFHEQFEETQQAYPYAGSSMEPFAWAAPLFNYMDKASLETLVERTAKRLAIACDPDWEYKYPIIKHRAFMNEMPDVKRVREIYDDPHMQYITLYNWYQRQEPFTGAGYRICYLNVNHFSQGEIKQGTREEIAALKIPLIENDWGVGLTFYYMYLCALISGNFDPIKNNWKTICSANDYFDKLHDWACMGTSFADNGICWVEGANYGAFSSFINMAEAIGESDSYKKGVYLGAKQLALRLAVFRSSQTYFHRFFNHAPWYITKIFHEEAQPSRGFINIPVLWQNKYRFEGIYNLTTEGVYPELFSALQHFLPDDFKSLRSMALDFYRNANETSYYYWGAVQESSSCLMAAALDEDYNEEKLLFEIAETEERGHLIKEWRGIHIYSRLLPKNYFKCQLLAYIENRKHPIWLEHWVNVGIVIAEYDRKNNLARIKYKLNNAESGSISFGIRKKPNKILLNEKPINGKIRKEKKLELKLLVPGVIEVFF